MDMSEFDGLDGFYGTLALIGELGQFCPFEVNDATQIPIYAPRYCPVA